MYVILPSFHSLSPTTVVHINNIAFTPTPTTGLLFDTGNTVDDSIEAFHICHVRWWHAPHLIQLHCTTTHCLVFLFLLHIATAVSFVHQTCYMNDNIVQRVRWTPILANHWKRHRQIIAAMVVTATPAPVAAPLATTTDQCDAFCQWKIGQLLQS